MKEKSQKCALFAEIIGGFAVIVTLIFLVLETQENTNAIQAQTYQSLTSELNELRMNSATSNMLDIQTKIFNSGYRSLTELEWTQQMFWVKAKWGIYNVEFES